MKNLILTGKTITALSFIIGTILLAFYLYFDNPLNLESIGLAFIIIAFCINSILFLILLISSILHPQYRSEVLKTCAIMLINIPIAIAYFFLVLLSLDMSNTF